MNFVLVMLENGVVPDDDCLSELWMTLLSTFESLPWRERTIVTKCLAQTLTNVNKSESCSDTFVDNLVTKFVELVSSLGSMIEDNKQPSLRLTALHACECLVSTLTHFRPGALVDNVVWSRIDTLIDVCEGDPDVKISGHAGKLKVARQKNRSI